MSMGQVPGGAGQMPGGTGQRDLLYRGGPTGQAGIPPPQTPKERDTAGIALAQALQGLGRELEAALTGKGGDPVIMSKFRNIIMQIQDAFARASAAGAASRKPANMEPQTGIAGQGNPALTAVRDYNQR